MMGIDPAKQRDMMEESPRGDPAAAGRRDGHHGDRLVQARRRPACSCAPTSAPSPRWPWRRRCRRPGPGRPAASAAACSPSAPPRPAASTCWASTGTSWRSGPPSSRPRSTATGGASSGPCTSPTPRSRPSPTSPSGSRSGSTTSSGWPRCPLAPNTENFESLVDALNASGFAVIGTVDDAIAQVERLQAQSGGFGTFLLMGHEWADTAATRHSYELIARYVAPQLPGLGGVADLEPGLGRREPPRVHRRGGQRRHVGHPEAPRGEGGEGRQGRGGER